MLYSEDIKGRIKDLHKITGKLVDAISGLAERSPLDHCIMIGDQVINFAYVVHVFPDANGKLRIGLMTGCVITLDKEQSEMLWSFLEVNIFDKIDTGI